MKEKNLKLINVDITKIPIIDIFKKRHIIIHKSRAIPNYNSWGRGGGG